MDNQKQGTLSLRFTQARMLPTGQRHLGIAYYLTVTLGTQRFSTSSSYLKDSFID